MTPAEERALVQSHIKTLAAYDAQERAANGRFVLGVRVGDWRFVAAILTASLLGFLLFGCGGTSIAPTPALDVTGTWTGLITSALGNGSAAARIAMTQNRTDDISGTWAAGGSTGTLTGTLNDQAVTLDLKPSTPGECPYNVTARVERTNEMTGLFSAVSCSGLLSGFVQLVKQ